MEYSQLLAKKKDAYAAYRDAREQAREMLTHRENLRPYLAPQGNAARAEVAAILMRFAQKIAK